MSISDHGIMYIMFYIYAKTHKADFKELDTYFEALNFIFILRNLTLMLIRSFNLKIKKYLRIKNAYIINL